MSTRDDEASDRALVATRYALGVRGAELARGVRETPELRELLARLGQGEREARGRVLAAELARIALELERWRLT